MSAVCATTTHLGGPCGPDCISIPRGELRAHECTECDCGGFDWNCRSRALKTDPPSTCECGHEESRHRFREGDA